MEDTSARFQLNAVDLWKILRGLLVLLAGAALTYASQIYLKIDYSFMWQGHLIDLTPIATITIGSVIEAGRRWLTDHQSQ